MTDTPDGGVEQYEPGDADTFTCEECGGTWHVDDKVWWKTASDLFWCDDCHEPFRKVERAEELHEEVLSLMVPESVHDGLSNEFHRLLDAAQVALYEAVEQERLRYEQGVAPHNTEGKSDD